CTGRPTSSAAGPRAPPGRSHAGASHAIFGGEARSNEAAEVLEVGPTAGGVGYRRPVVRSTRGLAVIAIDRRVDLLRALAPFLLGALDLPALLVGQRFGRLAHSALRGFRRALVVAAGGGAIALA